uniref:Uncharacterized protein n=1 Tax=Arundo donax TaxID=35708 RepID=A0A0A9GMX7_ARUDO
MGRNPHASVALSMKVIMSLSWWHLVFCHTVFMEALVYMYNLLPQISVTNKGTFFCPLL